MPQPPGMPSSSSRVSGHEPGSSSFSFRVSGHEPQPTSSTSRFDDEELAKLRSTDLCYDQKRTMTAEERQNIGIQPMPKSRILSSQGDTVTMPETNLQRIQRPPGLNMAEEIVWDVAMALEGRQSMEPPPASAWSDHLSMYTKVSKFLGYQLRHSQILREQKDNWISLRHLISENSKTMSSASVIFSAVMDNPKGRYEFSRPIYEEYTPHRQFRVSGHGPMLFPTVYLRAKQGHSSSSDPTAGMTKITEDNISFFCALHGTSGRNIRSILREGLKPSIMLPGSFKQRQAVHFAATMPSSSQEVRSGFKHGSSIVINADIAAYIEEGGTAYLSSNNVVNVFAIFPANNFLHCFDANTGHCYLTNKPLPKEELVRFLPLLGAKPASTLDNVPRERTFGVNMSASSNIQVTPDLPQLQDLEQEARESEAKDKDCIDPAEPLTAEEKIENISGRQRDGVKELLEDAMDQKLDDLKTTDRDPSDVQKALEQKGSEEEERPPQQTSDPSAGSSSRVSEHEPKKKKERKASSFLDTDPEDSEIERKGRWRPSLRRDKATNLPVLRPREVTQEEKRGITRSPSPDTRDGHYSKVHFRTNTGWRDISLWVDTEMLVQLREKDPDTLRGALRDRMGLTR